MFVRRVLQAGVLAAALVLGGAGVATAAPAGAGVEAAQEVDLFSGSGISRVLNEALAIAEANARAAAAGAGYTEAECRVVSTEIAATNTIPPTFLAFVTVGCAHALSGRLLPPPRRLCP